MKITELWKTGKPTTSVELFPPEREKKLTSLSLLQSKKYFMNNKKSFSPRRLPRPFLKWAGGKSQILAELSKYIPDNYNNYYEPFLGGGALFFWLLPKNAILYDINAELVNCYKVVKNNADELVKELKKYPRDKEFYYKKRDVDPNSLKPLKRAARTLYLNRAGFNGLYRVNSTGKFNVPFGRHPQTHRICLDEVITACSLALASTEIKVQSFEKLPKIVKKNDFVYMDPPYIPISNSSKFTAYQKSAFGMKEQEKLADVFDTLHDIQAKLMFSNSHHPWVLERYKKYHIHAIQAVRNINSKGDLRGKVKEVIVTNFK